MGNNIVPVELIQKALIAYLKSMPSLVAALGATDRIKEWFWQGDQFVYPAVRLQLGTARSVGEPNCGKWLQPFYIMCFSEQKSSKEASQLATLAAALHGISPGTLNGVSFTRFDVDQIVGPIRQDELTWRSEVIAHSTVCYP